MGELDGVPLPIGGGGVSEGGFEGGPGVRFGLDVGIEDGFGVMEEFGVEDGFAVSMGVSVGTPDGVIEGSVAAGGAAGGVGVAVGVVPLAGRQIVATL